MRTVVFLLFAHSLLAQAPPRSVNPLIRKVVDEISEKNIEDSMRKLESFETRGNFSETDHPSRGIGAARKWIFEKFQLASPRLQVRFDSYKVKKQNRIWRDVELVNVVAVLPGTRYPERQILVSGHYDSWNAARPPQSSTTGDSGPPQPLSDEEQQRRANAPAPGVSDDASGVAAALELARVLSQYEFEKTLVFIAFAGEELGLVGSGLHAAKAKDSLQIIEAVLNNDIIGTEVSGDGRRINRAVRVFSDDPNDSVSRQLARYVKEIGERYFPKMEPLLIFRSDRVARGGDHTPFALQGYPAVRFTSAVENYTHQHSATDTIENASPEYTANVARLQVAVAASLAMAPRPPETLTESNRSGVKVMTANIGRGKTGYDALLRWKDPDPAPDLSGYAVVVRSTIAPYWEKEIFTGKETEYLLSGVDIDNHLFGVKAIDQQGNESVVASFTVRPAFRSAKIETYE